MTPPTNSKVPKIRFKGFEAEWEEKTLGQLCESLSYGLNAAAMEYDGTNKYLRITDIDDETRAFRQCDLTSPKRDLSESDGYLLQKGDIVFARTGASVGKTYLYQAEDGRVFFAGFLIRARTKADVDERFVFQGTLTHKYNGFVNLTSQRSGQPGINAQEYSSFSLHCPSSNEQIQIGDFFRELDRLISLQKCKHDKLVTLKKAMLQKMFPQPGSTTPEIRFKGFSGDWAENKLSHFLEVSTEKNPEGVYSKDDVLSVSGDVGVVNQIEFQGRSFAGKSVSNYGVVRHGWIVYTKSPLKASPFGIIKTNQHAHGIVSTLYAVYRPKEYTDSVFVQYYFELERRLSAYLRPLVNKGAKNDMKVSDENVLLGPVIFPAKEEQQKIGHYFRTLDELISKHVLQLAKLKQIKSACLEKMFV